MEHKFGIFHTVEELNRAAAAQKAEGDLEALTALALENGLDREDAEEFMEGELPYMCTPCMAAIGKVSMEAEELGLESQLADWKDYLIQLLLDYPGDDLCNAVFLPEKKLLHVIAQGLKKASENRVTVNREITKAAGLPESAGQIGMCGRDELKGIILNYYLGGKQDDGI